MSGAHEPVVVWTRIADRRAPHGVRYDVTGWDDLPEALSFVYGVTSGLTSLVFDALEHPGGLVANLDALRAMPEWTAMLRVKACERVQRRRLRASQAAAESWSAELRHPTREVWVKEYIPTNEFTAGLVANGLIERYGAYRVRVTHNPGATPVGVCPTPCDDDCDADCHEDHQIAFKKDHSRAQCPGVAPENVGEPLDVCLPRADVHVTPHRGCVLR